MMLHASTTFLATTVLLAGGCGQVDVRDENRRLADLLGNRLGRTVELPESAEAVDLTATVDGLSGSAPWTPDGAVGAALLAHPSVRAELARIAIAKADLVQAELLPNPDLGVVLPFASFDPLLMFSVQMTQSVGGFVQRPAKMQAARAVLDRTLLHATDSILADIAAVRRTFHELRAADESVELLTRTQAIYLRSVEATKARKEAGAATAIDVNLAEGQWLGIQAEHAGAMGRREALRADFATRVGRQSWEPAWTLAPAEPDAEPPALDMALAAAAGHRPDLAIADARIAEAEAELRRAEVSAIPLPNVGVGAQENPPIYVGPAFTWEVPIFDQGIARVARANFALTEARRNREAVAFTARREVLSAHAELTAAHARVVLLRDKLVPTVERNLELAEQAYQGGQTGLLTVLAAQQAFLEAKRKLLEAARDFRVRGVELERATGSKAAGKS